MSMARLVITAVTSRGGARVRSPGSTEYPGSGCRSWSTASRREGEAAFEPRSRRPHTNPRAVDLGVEDQIVRLRKR